jgi:8-oxo-dGTP pyrophosphatase MutT (NUDIX family)/GNAT superfamily N-acetyltransferase
VEVTVSQQPDGASLLQHFGGSSGDLPSDLKFRFFPGRRKGDGTPHYITPHHAVEAHSPSSGGLVGSMTWAPRESERYSESDGHYPGEISNVWVHEDHRRKGIASAMMEHAKERYTSGQADSFPIHSPELSEDGRTWMNTRGWDDSNWEDGEESGKDPGAFHDEVADPKGTKHDYTLGVLQHFGGFGDDYSLDGLKLHYEKQPTLGGEKHVIHARLPDRGAPVGSLSWVGKDGSRQYKPGEITWVQVGRGYDGKGVARKMLEHAQQLHDAGHVDTLPMHSDDLTRDGRGFVKSVSDGSDVYEPHDWDQHEVAYEDATKARPRLRKKDFQPVSILQHFAEAKSIEVAGLCLKAKDSGRILLIQRSNEDESDPARGTWEFPGGHIDEGEDPLAAARREFSEETGLKIPSDAEVTANWVSPNGIYQGFVLTIPTEDDIDLNPDHEDRHVRNPDDPKGDDIEVVAWWDIADLPDMPALRKEVKHTPWKTIKQALLRESHVLDTWQPTDRLFAPTNGSLDPRLFDGDRIRPEVRDYAMGRLAAWWDGRYSNWRTWSKVYIAGSSISEWWADKNAIQAHAADREVDPKYRLNDDLDTLIGVEYKGLVEANPQFAGMSPKMVSAHLNAELREHCNLEGVYLNVPSSEVPEWEWAGDPEGGKVRVGPWSSTFYVNPNSYDIRVIKPYAAYNLSDDEWAVRPVSEPKGHKFSPTEWYYFEGVAQQVKGALALPEPARSNRAKRIWEHIHSSRSGAFGPHGQGVFDYRNAVEKYLDQAGLWQQLVDARFPDQKTSSQDHEVTYHLTDNPHFALNPDHQPEDNALSIRPREHKGLYTAERPSDWTGTQGYVRPYVAEIHSPKGVATDERWGGEKFIPAEHFDKVKVHRVIPLDAHEREAFGEHGRIESHHGSEFDSGKPIERDGWDQPPRHHFGEGYHYDGPDVRDMTPEQHTQHYNRWKGYMTGDRGFGHNEFDDVKQTLAEPKDEDFDEEGMFIKRDQHGQKIASKVDPTTLHPNMNHYRDSGMGGQGEDRSVIGYVSTDALRKMHGNETERSGVEHYRESLRNGEGFKDPAMVIFDPKTHHAYLGEGNHRVQAAHEEGVSHVPVRVVRGSVNNPAAQHMEHAETPYRGNLGEDYWPSDIHPSHIFASDEVLSEGKEDPPRSSPRLARLRIREGRNV